MEILKSQVAEAMAKETDLRTALRNVHEKETRLLQEAQDARQKVKGKNLTAKKIRAEINILKARAQDHEKEAKGLKFIRLDLEEDVEEATHERTNLERQLEDMKYEEVLVERYRDPIIHKFIKRMDKDYDLNEILESLVAEEGRLQDAEALEVKPDSLCKEDSQEKGEMLGPERDMPDGEDMKERDTDPNTGGKSGHRLSSSQFNLLTRI
jgi:chromosome segregation ATPase